MTNLVKILFTVLAISVSSLGVQAQAQERQGPRYLVRALKEPVKGSNGLIRAELYERATGKSFSAVISQDDIVPFAHYMMAIRPDLIFWDI